MCVPECGAAACASLDLWSGWCSRATRVNLAGVEGAVKGRDAHREGTRPRSLDERFLVVVVVVMHRRRGPFDIPARPVGEMYVRDGRTAECVAEAWGSIIKGKRAKLYSSGREALEGACTHVKPCIRASTCVGALNESLRVGANSRACIRAWAEAKAVRKQITQLG